MLISNPKHNVASRLQVIVHDLTEHTTTRKLISNVLDYTVFPLLFYPLGPWTRKLLSHVWSCCVSFVLKAR